MRSRGRPRAAAVWSKAAGGSGVVEGSLGRWRVDGLAGAPPGPPGPAAAKWAHAHVAAPKWRRRAAADASGAGADVSVGGGGCFF